MKAVTLSGFLAAALEKAIPVTDLRWRYERRCMLCGETYVTGEEYEDHAASLDGVSCGGRGEVIRVWAS